MIKGRKVYDPLTDKWSTGYWIPVYSETGQIRQYSPVWREYKRNAKDMEKGLKL